MKVPPLHGQCREREQWCVWKYKIQVVVVGEFMNKQIVDGTSTLFVCLQGKRERERERCAPITKQIKNTKTEGLLLGMNE